MKVKKTLQKVSEDELKLISYLAEKPHGTILKYKQVQQDTGIKMNRRGRDKLRKAILKNRREYSCIKGEAYRLAQADMTMEILTHRLVKIDNQVKRADRAHQVLQATFILQLTEKEQKAVIFLGAVFGAIRLAAEQGRHLYIKKMENPRLSEAKPIVPEFNSTPQP